MKIESSTKYLSKVQNPYSIQKTRFQNPNQQQSSYEMQNFQRGNFGDFNNYNIQNNTGMQPQTMPMQLNGQMQMQINGQQFQQQQMPGFRQQIPAGVRPQQAGFMPPQVMDSRFPRNMQPAPMSAMDGMTRMGNPSMAGMNNVEMTGLSQNPSMMGQMMPRMTRMTSAVPGISLSTYRNPMPNQGQTMNAMNPTASSTMMNTSNMMSMRTVGTMPQSMTLNERNAMMMSSNQHPLQSKQMRYQMPPSQFQQNLPMGSQNFQMGSQNFQNAANTQSFPNQITQQTTQNPKTLQNFQNPPTPQGYQNPTTPGSYQNPTTPLSQQNPLTPQGYQNPSTPVSYQSPTTPGSYQNPTTPLSQQNPVTPQGYQNPSTPVSYPNPTTPGSYQNPGTPNSFINPRTPHSQNPPTPHSVHNNPLTPQSYAESPANHNPRTPQPNETPPTPHSSIGINGIRSPLPQSVLQPNPQINATFTLPKTEPVIKEELKEPFTHHSTSDDQKMETSSAMSSPVRQMTSPVKNNPSPKKEIKMEIKQENIKEEQPESPASLPKAESPEPPPKPKTPEPYVPREPAWGDEEEMPLKALKKIFSFICHTDGCIPFLDHASSVCKYWNKVSSDQSLWVKANLGSWAIKEKSKNDKKIEWILENKFSSATHVDLCGWHSVVSNATLKIVAAACPNIVSLGLANCEKLNNEDVRSIPSLFPNLRKVDLSRVSPSSASSRSAASSNALSELVAGMAENLTHFTMSGNKMAGLPYVFNALSKHSKNLSLLDVSNISTTSRDPIIVNIEKLQKGCPKLTTLRTTNTMLTLNETSVREQVKSPGFPHMEELTIGVDNKGYFDGMDDGQIERILKSSKKLRLLDVRGCKGINDSTLVRLPAWDLEYLYVAGCSVTSSSSDGLELLVKKWGRTLKELDIGFTHKQKTVDWALMAFVEGENIRLRKLDLMGSNVGLKSLTRLLEFCDSLESLNLMDCSSLPRGMKRLYPTLEDVQRLKRRIPTGNFDENDSDEEC